MKHSKIFLSFKLTALMISLLFGGNALATGADSGWGKITELTFIAPANNKGGHAALRFSNPIQNPQNCDKTEVYVFELDESPVHSRLYSTILAAHMAGKTVRFWIHGCTKEKHWGATRPRIYDISVKQ